MLSTGHDRPQRYTVRLEVHLDAGTQAQITRFMTAFRRCRSAVLRQVLEWGLTRTVRDGESAAGARCGHAFKCV
jgi:hypothetical protein